MTKRETEKERERGREQKTEIKKRAKEAERETDRCYLYSKIATTTNRQRKERISATATVINSPRPVLLLEVD